MEDMSRKHPVAATIITKKGSLTWMRGDVHQVATREETQKEEGKKKKKEQILLAQRAPKK